MTPEDDDRATREIEELQQLFAANRRLKGGRDHAVTPPRELEDAATSAPADQVGKGTAGGPPGGAGEDTGARQRPSVQAKALRAIEPAPRTGRDEQRVPVWEPAPRDGASERPTPAPTSPRPKDPPVKAFDKALGPAAQRPAPARTAGSPAPRSTAGQSDRELAQRPVADRVSERQAVEQDDGPEEDAGARPSRRRSLWPVAALLLPLLLAASFAAGLGIGRSQHGAQVRAPAPAGANTVTSVSAQVRPAPAPNACLDTARYGDQVIDLLTANIRDQRINEPMRDYARASQACRAAAAP